MKGKLLALVLLGWMGLFVGGCATGESKPGRLYQTATISSLMQGVYDGDMTFSDLKWQGDFGIGTISGLDGEMVVLDGKFYQVAGDGRVSRVDRFWTTPFSAVTFFATSRSAQVDQALSFEDLERKIETLMPSKNIPYAIRIEGEFEVVRTRSVPKQSPPYKPLVEVVKDQKTFDIHRVRGTMVGFWMPQYMAGLNVPGYHFHFLSDDRTQGGHVLECRPRKVRIDVDDLNVIQVRLPEGQFRSATLGAERPGDLEKVEKQTGR